MVWDGFTSLVFGRLLGFPICGILGFGLRF